MQQQQRPWHHVSTAIKQLTAQNFREAEARAWNAHSAVYNRLEERRRQQEKWNTEQRRLLSEQTKLLGEARAEFFKL